VSKYQEQIKTCSDCSEQFALSPGEQAFYQERGFEPPKRRRPCWEMRKDQRGGDTREADGRR
jgi:hypothetical protein